MSKQVLVAVGGNSLLRAGERGTIAEQRAAFARTAGYLVQLIQHGYRLVLTHGNGPQVGAQLLRSEIASAQVSPEPLDVCVADTEGAIGYVLERALADALADSLIFSAGLPATPRCKKPEQPSPNNLWRRSCSRFSAPKVIGVTIKPNLIRPRGQ